MRLKLLYKSYEGRGIRARKDELVTVSDDLGLALLAEFPSWWEQISGRHDHAKHTKDVKREETGDQQWAVQK